MVSYYYFWDKKLSHEVCQKIIKLGKGKWKQAETLGSKNKEKPKSKKNIRKSDIVWTGEQWVYDLITPYMSAANEHAGWKYDIVAIVPCQLTRYTKDGFYAWHLDGIGSHNEIYNKPDNKFLHGNTRKLSMTIVLNSDYEGGDFDLRSCVGESKVPRFEEGSIIVFPSFMDHRVVPVTKGIRYSLVAWFVGPPFV